MCNKQSPISAFIAGGGGGGGSVNTGVLQTLGGGVLSGTLQTITDQSSNQSPLQLSTTKVLMGTSAGSCPQIVNIGETNRLGSALYSSTYVIYGDWMELRGNTGIQIPTNNLVVGTTLASARLHVRGVAGSSVTFFEPTSGGSYQTINSNFHFVHYHTTNFVGVETFRILNGSSITPSGSGIYRGVQIYEAGFSPSAGNSGFRPFNIEYTLSASGVNTATATGIFLNATETALNGMTHNLMDLQVGGVSRFRGTNAGALVLASGLTAVDNILTSGGDIQASGVSAEVKFGSRIRLSASADGVMLVRNNAGTSFTRLQLGGTTNAFPAIKRNGSEIDFRLADDSGFAAINTGSISCSANLGVSSSMSLGGSALFGSNDLGSLTASAVLEARSTTKGFLPPRMTTTQRGNIVSPATGLKLYNTSTNNTDTFDGTNWQSFGKETKITGSLEVNIASGKVINAIEVSSAMGLGFYNAAAIIQPVTGGASATYANVSGTEIKENDTFDGYTIGNVVKALRDLGLLA